MAVELRCPDCRAKLRLKSAPEAGTEIECPKCGTVFPAPDLEPEADEGAPKKKKKAAADEGQKAEKGEGKKAKKAKKDAAPKGPKKRKAKKQKTSKAALIGVISAGVLMLAVVIGVLIWFFSRTSKSVEMMYYLPEDTHTVVGWNVGHHQKYPEFYKSTSSQAALRGQADALAKGMGTEFDKLIDYVVLGISPTNGQAFVFRTKEEFGGDELAKVPGAEKQSLDGYTYYRIPLDAGQPAAKSRVFAPTNRLIVVCGDPIPDAAFRKMLNGHIDSKESTIGVRSGALGKRITRGTFWSFHVFTEATKLPPPPEPKEASMIQFANIAYKTANGAKGFGTKASLGSREIRLELVVWYNDSEKAGTVSKEWKESELGKGDDAEPPRWFKDTVQGLGDKKIGAQLLTNLGFGSSGDLFYVRSSVETAELKHGGTSMITKVIGQEKKQDIAAPAPPVAPAPSPRRRKWVRR
jgi:hypothetical protein